MGGRERGWRAQDRRGGNRYVPSYISYSDHNVMLCQDFLSVQWDLIAKSKYRSIACESEASTMLSKRAMAVVSIVVPM